MPNKNFTAVIAIFTTTLLFLIGCVPLDETMIDHGGLPAETGIVSGDVVVRNMIDYIELPEGAIVTVTLEDVSIADAPSVLLSERVYEDIAQLPLAYELRYDLSAVDDANFYTVSAAVTDADGTLLFISDTMHPVLTHEAGSTVDIELIVIDQSTTDESAAPPSELEGTGWKLRAFSLVDVWNEVVEGTEITLDFANGEVNGSAGCNAYFGTYLASGSSLTIGQAGSTLMACEENIMQQEALFLEALGSAHSYQWEENTLMIHYGEGVSLVFDRYQLID